jgi:hypothetical protein
VNSQEFLQVIWLPRNHKISNESNADTTLVATAASATTAVTATVSSAATVSTTATAAATTIAATASRFLRARFIHLQRAAFHFHAVEFANSLGGVIACAKFHKAEAAGTPGFAVGDDTRGGDLISLSDEKLLKRFIGHTESEIANVKFGHPRVLCLPCS